MICNQRILLILFIVFGFLVPAGLMAQEMTEGNHCVARESPRKMAIEAGKLVYSSKCVSCHQQDGGGSPGTNPSLIKSGQVLGAKQPLIELMIRGSHQQMITNRQKYQQVTPAYPGLTDEEVANVLTYIRHSFGNKASLVKTSEVKSARGE